MRVERADFDDLVTLVTQAPPWDKDRAAGVRILLRAIADGKPDAPEQILARWTWRLARAVRKTLDRKASQEYPDAKRLLGALANSRGNRHEENTARLVKAALEMPREVGAALLATAEGYTPRATNLLDDGAGAARDDPGDRGRARRRPAGAEDRPLALAPPPAPQEEGQRRGGRDRRRERRERQRGAGSVERCSCDTVERRRPGRRAEEAPAAAAQAGRSARRGHRRTARVIHRPCVVPDAGHTTDRWT